MRGRGVTMRSVMNGAGAVAGSAPQRHRSAHQDELGSELRARQRVGAHGGRGRVGPARRVVAQRARDEKCRAERGEGAGSRRPYQSHALMVRLGGRYGYRMRPNRMRHPLAGAILPSMAGGRGRVGVRRCVGALVVLACIAAGSPAVAWANPGALSRYVNGGDHWVTSGAVSAGYSLQGTLGFLAPTPASGTAALYGCLAATDHFLSLSSDCGGATVLGLEGWIYGSPPAGLASQPVYLCLSATTTSEDHFASNQPGCEGGYTIGLLGYALASAALNRYNGGWHWVTTGSVASGYSLEGTLGYLVTGGAGTAPLYGCQDGADHFLALSSSCEGQTVLGIEGSIYGSPPANVASSPIYRCVAGSNHFASVAFNCEGQVTEGLLGYALQGPLPPPPPPASSPAPVPLALPQPLPLPPTGHRHVRALRVAITFSWTWNRAVTHLRRVRIGRLPRRATIRISCRGRGCRARPMVARAGGVHRLFVSLIGRRFRAGERLLIAVRAPGYAAERAEIRIRYGALPTVRLL
jgi:hypothetical protein